MAMDKLKLLDSDFPLLPETLETKITNLLREAIITGRLEPSDNLRIHQIARQLGVSATPVNNALKRLEVEGYVAIAPRKGFRVIPLSHDVLEELVVLRTAIEAFAVETVVPRLTSRDIDALRQLLRQIDDVLASPEPDADRMFTLDQEFHLAIYRAAGRPSLVETITALRDRCRAYMHLASFLYVQHMQLSQEHHRQLLAAFEHRDVGTAKEIMVRHIHRTMEVLTPIIPEKEADSAINDKVS
jgi:DNA-binding GntR family transcriptional regulator